MSEPDQPQATLSEVPGIPPGSPLLGRIYRALVVFVAATALLLFLENTVYRTTFAPWTRDWFLPSWLFGIPAVLLVLRIFGRRAPGSYRPSKRLSSIACCLFLFCAWSTSAFAMLLHVAVEQAWPLNVSHGPDTESARAGFQKLVGVAPSEDVRGIYYRHEAGWQDSVTRLRFESSDEHLLEKLVQRHRLIATGDAPTGMSWSDPPEWWGQRPSGDSMRWYCLENAASWFTYIWFDEQSRTVWFETFNI